MGVLQKDPEQKKIKTKFFMRFRGRGVGGIEENEELEKKIVIVP